MLHGIIPGKNLTDNAKPFKSRRKARKKRKREDVGVISKKLTSKRERFDKTKEMRGMKNKKKRSENRSLWNTKRNRERRRRIVDRNSGRTVRKIGSKPGNCEARNTKRGVEMLK